MYRRRYWQDPQLEAVEALRERFENEGLDLGTASIAWTLAKPGITSAIIGASRPDQLEASIAAADLTLEEKLIEVFDEIWWRLPRRPVLEGYR